MRSRARFRRCASPLDVFLRLRRAAIYGKASRIRHHHSGYLAVSPSPVKKSYSRDAARWRKARTPFRSSQCQRASRDVRTSASVESARAGSICEDRHLGDRRCRYVADRCANVAVSGEHKQKSADGFPPALVDYQARQPRFTSQARSRDGPSLLAVPGTTYTKLPAGVTT